MYALGSWKHEAEQLLAIALPSIISTYCYFSISMTELSVMGHLGVDQLAAVAYSQMSMDFSTLIFMQGFNVGMNSLCSQAFGAKNYRLLGDYCQLNCFLLTIMCLPLACLWWNLGDLLQFAGNFCIHGTSLDTPHDNDALIPLYLMQYRRSYDRR